MKQKYIFTGGGTGGHLFPLIAVAEKLLEIEPDADLLFIGNSGKIESRVLPSLGYNFKSLNLSGLPRRISAGALLFPFKFLFAFVKALCLCIKFRPDVTIGSGAYVTFPVIWASRIMGARVVLMEANSYPGLANRALENGARKIFISFEDSRQYFRRKERLCLSGNPIRGNLRLIDGAMAKESFGLSGAKRTLLVIGGSLGARNINEAVQAALPELKAKSAQLIWQTGANYYDLYKGHESDCVRVLPFIEDVGAAYSACDLLLARAGATTIFEAAGLGLPVIFVPSPNVTADHQYKNAKSILDAGGCLLIRDSELKADLIDKINSCLFNDEALNKLRQNIKKFAYPSAASEIAEAVRDMAQENLREL